MDLDELLVPKTALSIPELLSTLSLRDTVHAFQFKTVFFCDSSSTSPGAIRDVASGSHTRDPLLILRDTVRSEYINNVRYKYIVKPEYTYESTIHEPLLMPRIVMRQTTMPVRYVNFSDAVLHHYRQIGNFFLSPHRHKQTLLHKVSSIFMIFSYPTEPNMTDFVEAKNCSIVDKIIHRFRPSMMGSSVYQLLDAEGFFSTMGPLVRHGPDMNFNMSLPGAGTIVAAFTY